MKSISTFLRIACVLTMAVTLSSCGVIGSTRHTETLPFDDGAKGKLVVLKAQDRLAYGKNFGAFCAEPSPDAISALATSLSTSLLLSPERKAELASTLQQNISGLGVRTQSIQLMRDALYRACEAFYSRALNKALYYDLHKRYQDHMIAVLAIEQLTGVVKGDQSAISGSSNAMVANSTADIQEILKDAQTIVEQEQANLTALNEGIKTNETKLAALDTEIATQQESANVLQAGISELEKAATPPASGTNETDEAKAERLAAAEQLAIKNTELKAANTLISARQSERTKIANAVLADKARIPAQQTIVDNAVQVQESVQENLNASLRQANAVASGSATLQAPTHQSTINPLTAKSLADTVQAIATSAINRPRTSDVCLDILKVAGGVSGDQRQQSPLTGQYLEAVDEKIINVCTDILSGYEAD